MRSDPYFSRGSAFSARLSGMSLQRKTIIGIILMVALLAFETFNFDTTQYALRSLLGDVRFLGLQWASILAIAFCSIDFAGLVRIFTPQKGFNEPREVWYLMGAWLLGAAMNAVMTWWAVSLTLLNHSFGNEVLNREQLLTYVPIFVAVLVWLTRILFIGAFTVAGEHIFDFAGEPQTSGSRATAARPAGSADMDPTLRRTVARRVQQPTAVAPPVPRTTMPNPMSAQPTQVSQPIASQPVTPQTLPLQPQRNPAASRVRQRPPMSNGRLPQSPLQAKGPDQH